MDQSTARRIARRVRAGELTESSAVIEGVDIGELRETLSQYDQGNDGDPRYLAGRIIAKAEAELECEIARHLYEAAKVMGAKGMSTLRFYLERRFKKQWGPVFKHEHDVDIRVGNIEKMSDFELQALIEKLSK